LSQASYFYDVERPSFIRKSKIIIKIKKQTKNKQKTNKKQTRKTNKKNKQNKTNQKKQTKNKTITIKNKKKTAHGLKLRETLCFSLIAAAR